jgi:YesN/AraC family two-component response regulator
VLKAHNGHEALRLLRHYRPDVILLDLVMPNMDGFQLLQERSQNAHLREVPGDRDLGP